jgi:hypothetical protein
LLTLEYDLLVVDLDNSSLVSAELFKAIVVCVLCRFVALDIPYFFLTLIKRAGLEKPPRFPGGWDQQRKTAK